MRRRWALIVIQLTAVGVLLFFLGWAFRGAWHEARPRLRDASFPDLAISTAILGAYYLLFTVAWQRILAAWDVHIPYFVALQAEMASILAKYVPGTVWIPAARIAALRRAGVRNTPLVLSSMLMEAGLSTIAGILVLFASLTTVGFGAAPVLPLLLLALITIVGLHPRVFTPGIRRVFRRFGASELPPLHYSTILGLIVYYCCTWLLGGAALFFLLRSVGGHPSATEIPYLGGIAAVSAIVTTPTTVARTWTTRGVQGTLIWAAVMFLGAALYEEIAFRGFLFPQLYLKFRGSHRVRFWAALLVSQFLFAISHIPAHIMIRHLSGSTLWTQVILQGVAGVMLLLLYLRTRNLWISAGIHGLANAPTPLFEGAMGWEYFLIALLVAWPWIARRPTQRGLAKVETRG